MLEKGIHHYFAYGSNMNNERMTTRGLDYSHAQAGALDGYQLTFNKMSRDHIGIGHATVEFALGRRVEGVLYTLPNQREILKMDPYERAPWNYGREVVRIATEIDEIWAWTYFANPAVVTRDLRPSKEYLAHLLAGQPYLSDAYYKALRSFSTSTV